METESLLKKHSPKKRGALKFIVALCGAAALAAVALPRANSGGLNPRWWHWATLTRLETLKSSPRSTTSSSISRTRSRSLRR